MYVSRSATVLAGPSDAEVYQCDANKAATAAGTVQKVCLRSSQPTTPAAPTMHAAWIRVQMCFIKSPRSVLKGVTWACRARKLSDHRQWPSWVYCSYICSKSQSEATCLRRLSGWWRQRWSANDNNRSREFPRQVCFFVCAA